MCLQCCYSVGNEEETIHLMQFLMGLNECYASVRSNLLMGSPLPSVNTVFNLISQEESHRSLASGNDKFVYAFTAKK